jgi:signal transduction histidine kinase
MSDQVVSSEAAQYFEPEAVGARDAGRTEAERCALEAVNRRVAAAETLGDLLDLVLAETSRVSPTDRLSVAFVEPGDRVVSHTTRADYSPLELGPGYSEGLAGSSLAEVIASGRTRVIPDLEVYARQHPASRSTKLILAEGIASSMTCPLSVEGRNVGLFWRSSKKKNAYDRHQVVLHLAVAERLSQAVEKAYRIEQLAAANAAYAEMLGFVSHELQSPVASIMTDVNLILAGYLGEVGKKHREKLAGMLRKGDFLLAMVRDYLNLARVDAGELSADLSEVRDFTAEVVQPAIGLVRGEIEERGQKLTLEVAPNLPAVKCDPALLRVAVLNFVSNASKYGIEGGRIRVSVAATGERLRLGVWNSGPGFPLEQRGRLFRRFSRVNDPELRKRKGTGVGLYTSARVVAAHGGRVGADARPGEWAEFWFEIPLAQAITSQSEPLS